MDRVELAVKYALGHAYTETWQRQPELHCPACGEKEVWEDQGGGDYHVGAQLLCSACEASFHIPLGWAPTRSAEDAQRLAVIRSAGA